MTHEHRPGAEHDHGPEYDERLPDARTVATFDAPSATDLPPLLADLDEQVNPGWRGDELRHTGFTPEELAQLDESVAEQVRRGEL